MEPPVNLYAITPSHAPNNEVEFLLADDDERAKEHGVFVAAKDVVDGLHFSPTADVYLIARDVQLIDKPRAVDAPASWEWAHPAVENNQAVWDAEFAKLTR
jgi:hypothetical protein